MNWLKEVRVIDLSQYIPGPFATRQLADLGANVIKIEPPAGDPMRRFMAQQNSGMSSIYRHINRGKRVASLDLKSPADKSVLENLLVDADVLLESYRPGVLERLGLSRKKLQEMNSGLIHCALSGYGQTGPYRLRGGHDINYLASSGMLACTGTKDKPIPNYPPLADHAGALQAATAILGALYARTQTGKGTFIDISLFESSLSWNYLPALSKSRGRAGNMLDGGAACYNVYQCADGEFVSLGALEIHFWERFCKAVERPEWIERQLDELPQTDLINELQTLFSSKSLAHWKQLLDDVDCCFEPLLDTAQLEQHPQIHFRQSIGGNGAEYPAVIDDERPHTRPDFTEITVADSLHW